jgi:hypothetical protein
VRFAYVTSLRVETKTNAYTVWIKDITDIGTETASYKVLPLGNNVCSMDSICFVGFEVLTAVSMKMAPYLLPLPSLWYPCFLLLTGVERTDSPRLLYFKIFFVCLQKMREKNPQPGQKASGPRTEPRVSRTQSGRANQDKDVNAFQKREGNGNKRA